MASVMAPDVLAAPLDPRPEIVRCWYRRLQICPWCAGLGSSEGLACGWCAGSGNLFEELLANARETGRQDVLWRMRQVAEHAAAAVRLTDGEL